MIARSSDTRPETVMAKDASIGQMSNNGSLFGVTFKSLLNCGDAEEQFPIPNGYSATCEIICIGEHGEIGYKRVITPLSTSHISHPAEVDGYFVYNIDRNTTTRIPSGYELKGFTTDGLPIVNNGSINLRLTITDHQNTWTEMVSKIDGKNASFECGDTVGVHVLSIGTNRLFKPREYYRFSHGLDTQSQKRQGRIENLFHLQGVTQEFVYGVGSMPNRSYESARVPGVWSDTNGFVELAPPAMVDDQHQCIVRQGVTLFIGDGSEQWNNNWGLGRLRNIFIGELAAIEYDEKRNRQLKPMGVPLIWDVSREDLACGSRMHGDLGTYILGREGITAIHTITQMGYMLGDMGDNKGVLITPMSK